MAMAVLRALFGFASDLLAWCIDHWRITLTVIALGVMVWLHFHLQGQAVDAAVEKNNVTWQAREDQAKASLDAAIASKRAEIDALRASQAKLNEDWRVVYDRALQTATAATAARIQGVSRDITPTADRLYPLPVGFLRHAAAAADAANGRTSFERQDAPETLPQETLGLVDRPSGIPLSAFGIWLDRFADVGAKWRERALACDRWVDEQAATFNR